MPERAARAKSTIPTQVKPPKSRVKNAKPTVLIELSPKNAYVGWTMTPKENSTTVIRSAFIAATAENFVRGILQHSLQHPLVEVLGEGDSMAWASPLELEGRLWGGTGPS